MACYKVRPVYSRAVPANRSCAAGHLQRQSRDRAKAEPSTSPSLVYFRQEKLSITPEPGETLLQVGAKLPPFLEATIS